MPGWPQKREAEGKRAAATQFDFPALDAKSLDDVLRKNGVTSEQGLREAVVSVGLPLIQSGDTNKMREFAGQLGNLQR